MIALLVTVFGASLLGSLHCAGMCGPFVAFAVSGHADLSPRGAAWFAPHAAYHLGRLVVYVTLGTLFGLLGSVVDLGGTLAGVQQGAALAAGATLIAIGILAALRGLGIRFAGRTAPGWLTAWLATGHRLALGLAPVRRSAVIGLLTALLPCGWLYAFAVAASGTGGAGSGAAVMLAFWAGTLPILAGLGLGVQRVAPWFGRRLHAIVSVALVVVGLLTVWGRIAAVPAVRGGRIAPVASLEGVAADVRSLDPSQAACCRSER